MSYTYSLEQGEVSSAASFSDIPAYVLSRLNLTAEKSCCNGNGTESCQSSPSGTTCGHSTGGHGEGSLTLCVGDFRARTSVPPDQTITSMEGGEDWMGRKVVCGWKCAESFAKWSRDLCKWKTRRGLFQTDSEEFSGTWPAWGSMRDGECYRQEAVVPRTSVSASGLWLPTPTAHNAKEGAYPAEYTRNTPTLAATVGGKLNPELTEWMMGLPIGYSDLKPLGTLRSQSWLHSHGRH